MNKCDICAMRVGRVLSEQELKALLKGDLIVPDREVCRHREALTCTRKRYEISNGHCVSILTTRGGST